MVCDLPVPRRALDDQVLAGARRLERLRLRGIRVEHVEHRAGREALIERLVPGRIVGGRRGRRAKAVGQQRAQQRPGRERRLGGPGRRIEVPVHQELAEREQAEHDVVGVHPKARRARHGFADLPEVGRRIEPFLGIDRRQGQGKLVAQLLGQRQVGRDLLLGEPQAEALQRARPLQPDRHQDQGRVARRLGRRRLAPFEEPERQVEDADAPLLVLGAGVVVEPEQARLEALGTEPGLQPEVPVLRQGPVDARGHRPAAPWPRTGRRSAARRPRGGPGRVRTGAKAQALAVLDQEPEEALAALTDHFERAGPRRVARRVEQPVAPRQIEELLARLLQYAVDVAHRIRALLGRINLRTLGSAVNPWPNVMSRLYSNGR